mgnify:CR=1 FL=1|tara:strand:+ start:572 stop:1780 length:1209 start_codon:yes stop_codon:yes gene_type:complete
MEPQTTHDIVRAFIHEWTGNDAEYGRLLFERTGEKNPNSWRLAIQRFKAEYPDEMPVIEKDNPNELIPEEWAGGAWTDLARILHEKRPDISVHAWQDRVYQARMAGKCVRKAHNDFIVTHLKGPKISTEDLWNEIELRTTRAISNHENERWADIHFDGKKYIGIAFAADQHIGSTFCDMKRMREDAEMVAATPNCYAIMGGDFIDNFLPADKAFPAAKATILPDKQWTLMEHYIDMFDGDILAVVAGNHDQWTKKYAGIDPLADIMEDRDMLYQTDELNVRVFLGKQPYHIAVRHKRRGNSQIDPARVVKKMWEDGESDFDIGVVCHNHVPITAPFTRHGVERWAIRPGSYKVIDKFAEMIGFASDRPTCPLAILNPDTREIQVFTDLRQGVRTLKILNGDE